MKATPLLCVSLLCWLAIPSASAAELILPKAYYRTFSAKHPVLARIKPGDTITTTTLDAAAHNEKGELAAEPGNPLTGPFFVEGAEPGDVLLVHLRHVRMTR